MVEVMVMLQILHLCVGDQGAEGSVSAHSF